MSAINNKLKAVVRDEYDDIMFEMEIVPRFSQYKLDRGYTGPINFYGSLEFCVEGFINTQEYYKKVMIPRNTTLGKLIWPEGKK